LGGGEADFRILVSQLPNERLDRTRVAELPQRPGRCEAAASQRLDERLHGAPVAQLS
jgi:hypothetical protein